MAIEFVGFLADARSPGSPPGRASSRPDAAQDPDYPARVAGLHEESGFDWLQVGDVPGAPRGFVTANQVLTTTSRLGVLLVHRPGLVAPTVAARQYATLEAFHPGRVAMHLTPDDDEGDQRQDEDGHDKRPGYPRLAEFLEIVKRTWSSREPFDYSGDFYRVAGAVSQVRPTGGALSVYLGGASAEAVRIGARHADVYGLGAQPAATIAQRIATIRAAAAQWRRSPRFSVRVRPIAAATEQAAWNRASRVLSAERVSWPRATGGPGALVGSYEQVAGVLLGYVAAGISVLEMCGFRPEADGTDCAAIIRLVRERSEGNNCLVA